MKVCPKCSVTYSEMWNICAVCKKPLRRESTFLKKVITRFRPPSEPPFSIIESIIDQAHTIFLYLDENFRPVICNRAIEHITGYSRDEIFNDDWPEILFRDYPSRTDMFKAFLESCLTSIKSRVYECAVTKKDGSECILSWKNAAVTNAGGNVSGIICTAYDITERKGSEDDAAVRYERLRNIFASIKDYALITTNLEEKITYYEKSSAELLGWQGDMSLRGISILFPKADRYKIMNKIKGSITKYGKFEEEVVLQRHKEEVFPAILTVTTLLDNKNEKTGYVYIARDITKRKELEEQVLQSEKLAAIGQLAAGIAHEINNPLLVIAGRLDMLTAGDKKLPPELKHILETIKSQAQRMRIIADRLLSYSRRKTPRMDMVDVNEILKTISPLLAYHPEFKKILWKEELTEDLPKIRGDFNQLQEVFLNIGLNACQAMPEGGVITISSKEKKDGFMEVEIKDTGIGIKKEDLNKLFTPFFTARDGGTGLGLAMCQAIINSHGGKADVESEPGKGSTFKIRLPIKGAR